MPAKRKRPALETDAANNVRLRKRLGGLLTDHFKDVDGIRELEAQLADMRQELERLGTQLRRTEKAGDAEAAYWKYETMRLHQELVTAWITLERK
jgi:uncharacterized small protein (DUF1192 family)